MGVIQSLFCTRMSGNVRHTVSETEFRLQKYTMSEMSNFIERTLSIIFFVPVPPLFPPPYCQFDEYSCTPTSSSYY